VRSGRAIISVTIERQNPGETQRNPANARSLPASTKSVDLQEAVVGDLA
jgi:hypothetical protein